MWKLDCVFCHSRGLCSKGELIENCSKDCEENFLTCSRSPPKILLEKLIQMAVGVTNHA